MRTPGVTMRKPRPHSLRMRAISSGEATTPSIDASRASRARRTTWLSTPACTPTRRRSSRVRLVSTVTASIFGRRSCSLRQTRFTSVTLCCIIARLPEACRSNMRTPHARRLGGRFRDGARDVVELEVEEDLAALLLHHADDRRPGVQEELLADLEEADLAHQRAHQLLRLAELRRRRARRSADFALHPVGFR